MHVVIKRSLIILVISTMGWSLKAQSVYAPIESSVYQFLDEMANNGWIDLSSVVQPYDRLLIAHKLQELDSLRGEMNPRQVKELDFYLKDFNKELKPDKNFDKRLDLFYYKDSVFSLTINPIFGGQGWYNDSGVVFHRWNGAQAWGYLGKHLGFWASLRDNGVNRILAADSFLIPMQGANYKLNQGNGGRSDWSEMRGGITWGNHWGSIGIVKDRFTWGNNYAGANIFGGKNPTYAYVTMKLHPVPWARFQYIHGFLASEVLDSAKMYVHSNGTREVYRNKFIAANMISFRPFKKTWVSFGNSVIYADGGDQLGYMIPFMFFKSVDHTYNGAGSNRVGQNSQMFFDISTRIVKHFHFYTSMYLDELSISHMFDPNLQTNLWSNKVGMKMQNFLLQNFYAIAEYTRTNPWAYVHEIPTLTFKSNNYTLGHYLGENAEEVYLEFGYKPMKRMNVQLSYRRAIKGPESVWKLVNGVPNIRGSVWIDQVRWYGEWLHFQVKYEILNDIHARVGVLYTDQRGLKDKYTPTYFHDAKVSVTGGLTWGF